MEVDCVTYEEEEMEVSQADFLLWGKCIVSSHSDHATLVPASSTFFELIRFEIKKRNN